MPTRDHSDLGKRRMSTESSLISSASLGRAKAFFRRNGRSGSKRDQSFQPRYRWYPPLKTATEYVVAVTLLPLAVPIVLVAAICIKVTSRGNVFYWQTRLGKDGRPFTLLKLRTMIQNAEALTGPIWAEENDPRVTPVGRVLRNTHIDELPQLINVLLGQLSLIGPRPERPELVKDLDSDIPHYSQRLNIRPGVTGLAQLRLPADSDTETVRNKLQVDLYYVRHMAPWLDFRILCFTGCHMVAMVARSIWSLIDLPDQEKIQSEISELLGDDADTPRGSTRWHKPATLRQPK